jgi:hypothetical protein
MAGFWKRKDGRSDGWNHYLYDPGRRWVSVVRAALVAELIVLFKFGRRQPWRASTR